MREDLREAYLTAESESTKRQQLESDLRRMFLKNMTHMNMEALSLFHDNYNNTAIDAGSDAKSEDVMLGTEELKSGPPSAFSASVRGGASTGPGYVQQVPPPHAPTPPALNFNTPGYPQHLQQHPHLHPGGGTSSSEQLPRDRRGGRDSAPLSTEPAERCQ